MELHNLTGRVGVCFAALCLIGTGACTNDAPTQPSHEATPTLTAPVNDSPADDLQLSTLQPPLRVTNGTPTSAGSRTYEFQVADAETFTTLAASGHSVGQDHWQSHRRPH